jgi:ketol-acid reductoisomerase
MTRAYRDADANPALLAGRTVGIFGYGIQGRAQALNLRDSGVRVRVANRSDSYLNQVREDGFEPGTFEDVASEADILLLLVPDHAHQELYDGVLHAKLKPQRALVLPHGYSLLYKRVQPRADLDVMLLAPRMPGKPIREYYLKGSGVPAFIDVFQDATGEALAKALALAAAMGFTRAGVLPVSVREETEVDLFVEQFLVPQIMRTIEIGFETLEREGYEAAPALMEMYASGELGVVLSLAAELGLYRTFQKNASPTCQYGIASSIANAGIGNPHAFAAAVLKRIQSGQFARELDQEGKAGYPQTSAHWEHMRKSAIERAENEVKEFFKRT